MYFFVSCRYKLCYYRFGELVTEYGKPAGYVNYLISSVNIANAFLLFNMVKLEVGL